MEFIFAAADMTGATQAAEQLATKSDRYLFLLSLVLLIGGGALAVRWVVAYLVKQNQGLVERWQAERDANDRLLGDVIAKYHSAAADMSTALGKCSQALDNNTNALHRLDERRHH